MTRVRPIIVAISVSCVTLFASRANAANCATYLRDTIAQIGPPMLLLQQLEQESADRLKGLDTRPFNVLRDRVKEAAAIVAAPDRLKDEEGLVSCASKRRPVRKICAEAAALLTAIITKYAAEPKPDYDRPHYVAAMVECETLLQLTPLKTFIRGNE